MGQLAAQVVDHVISEHLDLFFGVHMSVVVACRRVAGNYKVA